MHMSRDRAHAQWLQTHCQWYPMEDVKTQERTAIAISNLVGRLTTWLAMYDHWPRS